MPLEDFFTLTEMKDGLATLARVEELVGVMKEKGNTIKNVVDAARQWSSVASVLAATENKECLNLFIKLDGLPFLDQWLQEAQKCDSEINDGFSEESISTLLGALEMLPIGNEWSTVSGIGVTVKNLLGHKNIRVQEKARALLGAWNQATDESTNCQDVEEDMVCLNGETKSSKDVKITVEGRYSESPVLNVCPSKGSPGERNCVGYPAVSGFEHSMSTKRSDVSQLTVDKIVKVPTSDQDVPLTTWNQGDAGVLPGEGNSLGSSLSNTRGEISFVSKDSSPSPGDINGLSSNVSALDDSTNGLKEVKINMNKKKESLSDIHEKQTCDVTRSCELEELVSLPVSAIDDQKCDNDAKEGESCPKKMVPSDLMSDDNIFESQLKNEVDCSMPTFSGCVVDLKPAGKDDECHEKALWGLSSFGCTSRKQQSPENSLHGKDVFRMVDDVKKLVCESNSEASEGENSSSDILNQTIDAKDSTERDKGTSAMEIDYGADDALEVARQVAKEVEQEVVDYRGPFCSFSPEKNSQGDNMQSDGANSLLIKQDGTMVEKLNETKVELPVEQDIHRDEYSSEVMRSRVSDSVDAKADDHQGGFKMPSSTTAAQEMISDVEKSKCGFDLNEEVYTEETECLVVPFTNQQCTLSAPIPVVAAPKGTPGLPSSPLRFEGELGWRGSASTSAFRPPSARRTLDGGSKTSLVDANSSGSRQGQSSLKIDLNVASDENGAVDDAASTKHFHVAPGLSSRVSFLEVRSVRSERPKLDLNRLGDSDDACPFSSSDWRMGGQQYHVNGHHSQPPTSSSSSAQPPVRDFDLNDNPFFADISGSHDNQQSLTKSPFRELKNYGSNKLDDPVLSILGSRVDVNRKNLFNGTHSAVANGQGDETAFSTNLVSIGVGAAAQPSSAYGCPPSLAFGYNDLTVRPTLPFPLQMYRPTSSVPYTINSRGTTVVPQLLGAAATIQAPFSRPPFLMGPAGAPSGLSGVGVASSCVDLNSGMTTMDGERTEVGSFRQFFVHSGGSMEEQMRSPLLHPTGTGMMLKRKEPEGGWELNMV